VITRPIRHAFNRHARTRHAVLRDVDIVLLQSSGFKSLARSPTQLRV
jgi:hypothetical protein